MKLIQIKNWNIGIRIYIWRNTVFLHKYKIYQINISIWKQINWVLGSRLRAPSSLPHCRRNIHLQTDLVNIWLKQKLLLGSHKINQSILITRTQLAKVYPVLVFKNQNSCNGFVQKSNHLRLYILFYQIKLTDLSLAKLT